MLIGCLRKEIGQMNIAINGNGSRQHVLTQGQQKHDMKEQVAQKKHGSQQEDRLDISNQKASPKNQSVVKLTYDRPQVVAKASEQVAEEDVAKDAVIDAGHDSGKSATKITNIGELQQRADQSLQHLKRIVQEMLKQQGLRWRGENVENKNDPSKPLEDDVKIEADVTEKVEIDMDKGYWGSEQTAERILTMAQSFLEEDPAKFSMIKDAVIAGFDQAKQALGGELPAISEKTYDRVMQGFDDMEQDK